MTVVRFHTRSGSPDRFGYSWAKFDKILPEHREQFLCWSSALPSGAWNGAYFLDVGCGIGRNSHWAIAEGAVGGIAIDVDERTLSAAQRNLLADPSVEVRYQSVYDLGEHNSFDIVFAIGVIHHLHSPEDALARMVDAAKPGGYVLIWVYGRENMGWLMRVFDPLRRAIFSKLPLVVIFHLSVFPTALLWCALRVMPSAARRCDSK